MQYLFLIRGTSSPGPPYTLSREPLRRLAPFAWLASLRSLALGARCTRADDRRHPCNISFLSGGLRPPDPLTPSLASRFAGSLRSRGSLRYARSHLALGARVRTIDVTHAISLSYPGDFVPRTPLHPLSRAASPARSVRVARFATLAR